MDRVSAATGAAEALSVISRKLSSSQRFLRPSHVVVGPPDCGKSRFCERLLNEHAERYYAVHLEGNRSDPQCGFFPFGRIMLDTKPHEHALSHVSESVSTVPTVGGSLKFLLSLLNLKAHAQRRQTFYLSEAERNILYGLESLGARKDVLLICDAMEAWDSDSLSLLSLMQSSQLAESFPVLTRTFFVFVLRDGAQAKEAIFKIISGADVSHLHRMDLESFTLFMRERHVPADVPAETLCELHRISGGAVSVAEMIATALRRGGYRRAIDESDIKALVRHHVTQTLESHLDADRLRNLLRAAATIGIMFTRSELQCLAGMDACQDLDVVESLSFLRRNGNEYVFSSELLVEVFGPGDYFEPETHRSFAECLRILRPDDYASRAAHLAKAEEPEAAAVMHIVAQLKSLREGRHLSISTNESAFLIDEANVLIEGHQLIGRGRYLDAMRLLQTLDPTSAKALLFERDIMLARAKIKSLDLAEQHSAIDVLQQWSGEFAFEFEIWQRSMVLLVVALGFVGRLEEAISEYKRLHQHLLHNPSVANSAGVRFRLELKRDVFLPPSIAASRIEEAVAYFGPPSPGAAARDPMNYYVGLSNLVASFVVRGQFSNAVAVAEAATSFLATLSGTLDDFDLPRPDVLANNATIAMFRAKKISAEDAFEAMNDLAAENGSNDRPLLLSNAAALAIEIGQYVEALQLLAEARRLVQSESVDPFYRYFVFNNAAMYSLATGNFAEARSIWLLVPQAQAAAPTLAQWLDQRDGIITAVLSSSECFEELQKRLAANAPDEAPDVPAPWRHLGQALLLSDLQFWSED